MKYFKKFAQHSDYAAVETSLIKPNVSICLNEGDVHINEYIETRIVAKFNVTDTTNPTKILNVTNSISKIRIDGVDQPSVGTGYTFSTTGEHLIKYTLKNQTTVTASTFYRCSGMTSISLPYGFTTIPTNFVREVTSLTSISLPDTITTIGNSAFNQCRNLVFNTVLPNITSLADYCFYLCTSIGTLTFGPNLTSIGSYAFNAAKASHIAFLSTTPPTIGGNVFANSTFPIYVPAESIDAYKAANNWSTYASRIQAIPT